MNPLEALRHLSTPQRRSTGRVTAVSGGAIQVSSPAGPVSHRVDNPEAWRVGDTVILIDGVPVARLGPPGRVERYWV